MKKIDEDHYLTSAGKVVPAVRTIIFHVAEGLVDEATELVYEFGHSRTEIGNEGIRSLSDIDGIVHRRREFVCGVNSQGQNSGDKASPAGP
jgi:hypothetical protein